MEWTISAIVILLLLDKYSRSTVYGLRKSRGAVGGLAADFDEFPFMAALGWTNNVTNEVDYICGGVLFAQNFVLTVAHCVFYEGKLPNIIKIGGNNLTGTDNEEHTVKMVFVHPEYNNTNAAYNDIAILELEKKSTKPPASLWTDVKLEAKSVIAIGYGTTEYAGSRTPILQKVKLKIVSETECEPYFMRERKFPEGIKNSHICAGDPEGKQDTCQGDSGGPLLIQKTIVAGLTSSGQACTGIPPAVYTRIAIYVDWISNILTEHGYNREDTILPAEERNTKYTL